MSSKGVFVANLVLSVTVLVNCASIRQSHVRKGQNQNVNCVGLPETDLRQILGPAFNPRYMSIDTPIQSVELGSDGKPSVKRTVVDYDLEFYVEDNYSEIISEKPAWDVMYTVTRNKRATNRRRLNEPEEKFAQYRNFANSAKPWECQSTLTWIDLGRDYFPRYLRTVECVASDCWYGHYKCKPRSFTVKLLKRRRGFCASTSTDSKFTTGQVGLPNDLRQLWIWEERALNFCCDCVA